MNRPALWMEADVGREIAILEQRVDALKHRLSQCRSPHSVQAAAMEAEVRSVLSARRAREEVISRDLFADPAWDILLYLFAALLGQQRVTISELNLASAVPATTALRWIAKLDSIGLIRRSDDPLDRRRVWVELSDEGEKKMHSFFETIRPGLLMT